MNRSVACAKKVYNFVEARKKKNVCRENVIHMLSWVRDVLVANWTASCKIDWLKKNLIREEIKSDRITIY